MPSPKNHRKTTPHWWLKKVVTYSPSKAVARNLAEEIPLDRPYREGKPKSPARLTDVEWQNSLTKS